MFSSASEDSCQSRTDLEFRDVVGPPWLLIIGDSISMECVPKAGRLLSRRVNIYRIPGDGKSAQLGVDLLYGL